jgi:hypothetical protein
MKVGGGLFSEAQVARQTKLGSFDFSEDPATRERGSPATPVLSCTEPSDAERQMAGGVRC